MARRASRQRRSRTAWRHLSRGERQSLGWRRHEKGETRVGGGLRCSLLRQGGGRTRQNAEVDVDPDPSSLFWLGTSMTGRDPLLLPGLIAMYSHFSILGWGKAHR